MKTTLSAMSLKTITILERDMSTKTKIELNNCRCGKGARIVKEGCNHEHKPIFRAQCKRDRCQIRTKNCLHPEKAAEIWNYTTPLDDKNKTIRHLAAALRHCKWEAHQFCVSKDSLHWQTIIKALDDNEAQIKEASNETNK